MINNIKLGEIINVENKEYVIVNTKHKNGSIVWEQPTLIKLKTLINNINRKPYYKRKGFEDIPLKKMNKGFECLKLNINKKGGSK